MITTHVLDLANGRPAHGVPVVLEFEQGPAWVMVGQGVTGENGRLGTLAQNWKPVAGTYRLTFDLSACYRNDQSGPKAFFRSATVVFTVQNPAEHYHVPLLISPFGYTIYRGS
jgi:5-hydroxyisourate hydrolase